MKSHILGIVLLCSFLQFCCADNVLDLTDSDFSSRVKDFKTALVMFYAPWCGHCKKIKPEYAKASEILKDDDPPIALIKVDCTEEGKDTCGKYSVTGYPTLKIFRNGDVSQDYSGPREAGGIVKYMRAQAGPSSTTLNTQADLDKFLSSNDVAVVGLFEAESDLKVAFLSMADKLKEKVRFGHTSDPAVLKAQGKTDAIVLFRPQHLSNKFEDDSVAYSGSADSGNINTFITKNYTNPMLYAPLDVNRKWILNIFN